MSSFKKVGRNWKDGRWETRIVLHSSHLPSKETFLAKAREKGLPQVYDETHDIPHICFMFLFTAASNRDRATGIQHLSSFLLNSSAMRFQLFFAHFCLTCCEICWMSAQCFRSNKDTKKKNIQTQSFQDPQADAT